VPTVRARAVRYGLSRGLLDPAGGSVRYRGKELVALPPHQLVGEGIALVPEGRGVFPRMTTVENLRMGAYARNDKVAIERDLEQVLSHFPRLKERAQQLAGTLSGGEQQMLAIGRALMSKPRLMLLDEPSMGLAPIMVQKIFEVICAVAKDGMTILLVEQNAKLALEVSQRGYVMESGEITVTDESKRLLADPKVRAAYLGE
jgi:branched-chain amino acid transport system ATP-binding protein